MGVMQPDVREDVLQLVLHFRTRFVSENGTDFFDRIVDCVVAVEIFNKVFLVGDGLLSEEKCFGGTWKPATCGILFESWFSMKDVDGILSLYLFP